MTAAIACHVSFDRITCYFSKRFYRPRTAFSTRHIGWVKSSIASIHVDRQTKCQQEGAAVEGPPAMRPSLQLSTCVPHNQLSYHIANIVLPTTQLAAVTLTSDPLTLKLAHGVLVSQGPFLPSLVFVDLFVFPQGGGTGQTDRRTAWGSIHDGASF